MWYNISAMKMRLLYVLTFVLIVGSIVYWWRVISFGLEPKDTDVAASLSGEAVIPPESIVIGSIASTPEEVYEEFDIFADFLKGHLPGDAEYDVQVKAYEDVAHASREMRQRRLDIFIDSAFPALEVSRLAEGEVLLNRWKGGLEKRSSVLFVRGDSPIQSLDDLPGAKIAFEHTSSTSAYLLPKADLISDGYVLRKLDYDAEPLAQGETGYYFAGTEEDILEDVLSGAAAIGALGSDEFNDFAASHDIRPIHQTQETFRHLAVFRDDMPPETKQAVVDFLLTLDDTSEGRALLSKFAGTTKFSAVTKDQLVGTDALLKLIETEILR